MESIALSALPRDAESGNESESSTSEILTSHKAHGLVSDNAIPPSHNRVGTTVDRVDRPDPPTPQDIYYDADDIGIPDSPPMKAVDVNFQPTSYIPPLPPPPAMADSYYYQPEIVLPSTPNRNRQQEPPDESLLTPEQLAVLEKKRAKSAKSSQSLKQRWEKGAVASAMEARNADNEKKAIEVGKGTGTMAPKNSSPVTIAKTVQPQPLTSASPPHESQAREAELQDQDELASTQKPLVDDKGSS